MNNEKFDSLLKKIKKGQIKACIVQQNGEILLDYYKNKKIQNSVQPIHSVSKSITSMLVGICIDKGLISGVDVKIKEYFSDYLDNDEDKQKGELTIENLLTMTPGFDWPEFGEWNYWTPIEFSKDIIKSTLERDLICEAGTEMNYNSGCSNLLSAIIAKVSGIKTLDFAYKYLFNPLGIKDVVWNEKQGISLGANGLKMKAEDLLKLGTLYLNEGKFRDNQLISKKWVETSTTPRFLTYPHIGHYAYHWWTSEFESEKEEKTSYYFAMGLFGQFIIVVPSFNLVTIFLSDNYGETMKPMSYFREIIYPIL